MTNDGITGNPLGMMGLLREVDERKKATIAIYVQHGATQELAEAICQVFSPLTWVPKGESLDDRVQNYNFQDVPSSTALAFEYLLREKPDHARAYLENADTVSYSPQIFALMKNVTEVQRLTKAARPDLDSLRQKYFQERLDPYLN